MPFAPDYSDFLRMKRIQKTIDVDSRLDARKTRSTYAYGAYNPTYQIGYLPPNLFLPGRLYPSPAPPAPPSDTFYPFASVETSGGKIAFIISLLDEESTTKINFGDGTVVTIPPSEPFDHTYAEGSYNITLSNPVNINTITCISGLLKTVTVGEYTSLDVLNLFNSTNLTTVSDIPASLQSLNISATAVTSITIPTLSSLRTILARTDTSLATITGIENATNLDQLDIAETAITDCSDLEDLFNSLPTPLGLTHTVTYTNSESCTTGEDPGSIEATAIAAGWTFAYYG